VRPGPYAETDSIGRFSRHLERLSQKLRSGVQVAVTPSLVPGMFLANTGPRPVTVLGREGEPFLRFTRAEGTEANLRSPSYVDVQRLRGEPPDAPADSRAEPRWRQVEDVPQYGWLETRARYGPEQPPDEVIRRADPTVLTNWTVPLESGSRRFDLKGRTSWVPFTQLGAPATEDGTGLVDLVLLAVAVIGIAGLALLLLRVQARRASRSFTAQ
jgi:hypothetical protein